MANPIPELAIVITAILPSSFPTIRNPSRSSYDREHWQLVAREVLNHKALTTLVGPSESDARPLLPASSVADAESTKMS